MNGKAGETLKKYRVVISLYAAIIVIYAVNSNFPAIYHSKFLTSKYYYDNFFVYFTEKYHNEHRRKVPVFKKTASDKLPGTKITPTLEEKVAPGKNLLFCAAFQMSWNELCKKAGYGSIELKDAPEHVKYLNAMTNEVFTTDKKAFFTIVGTGADNVAASVENELKRRAMTTNVIDLNVGSDEILAFSHLEKSFSFENDFEKLYGLEFTSSDFKKCRTFAFGIEKYDEHSVRMETLTEQLTIEFQSEEEYIISLKLKGSSDRLILSNLRPKGTLRKTFDEIIDLCDNKREKYMAKECYQDVRMLNDSELWIPKIDLKIIHEFKEMAGKEILGEGMLARRLLAVQSVDFKLDEKGVKLAADGFSMDGIKALGPTKYHFNRPFFVVMMEQGRKLPYFMLYVDNAELLVKM